MCSRILIIILLGLMALGTVPSAPAQEATPNASSLFADLGLPEITVTATDDGLDVSQREVPAGRYLVTLDNQSWNPILIVDMVRLVRDDTAFCEDRYPPLCFSWYSQTYLPGGVSGRTPRAIMNLPAGEYGFWGPGEPSDEPAAVLTVTGDPAAAIDGPEPEAAAIIVTRREGGRGFAIRVEGELPAGPQIVRIVNATDQPVFVAAAQDPASSISDQITAMQASDVPDANPSHLSAFDDSQFGRVTSTVPQSTDTTQWVAMNLTPGPVYLASYIPDPITTKEGSSGWYAATATVVPVAEP